MDLIAGLSRSRANAGDRGGVRTVFGDRGYDAPTPVGERRPDVPGAVSRLIDRCLQKHPRDRIQTATEILAELKAQHRAWESGAAWPAIPAAPDIVPRPVERVASIAVLPFTDMSATKDQDWFCDGIAEEILNALTPLKGLRSPRARRRFRSRAKATIFGPSARSCT